MSTKTDEERATETWSLIYSGLVKDGVKFPNNFDGIGAAYGGYARLIEAFTTLRKEQEEAVADAVKELTKEYFGMSYDSDTCVECCNHKRIEEALIHLTPQNTKTDTH